MNYLNYYLNNNNEVIFHFVNNKDSYTKTYKLIDTYIYNDELQIFQPLSNYSSYIEKSIQKDLKGNIFKKFFEYIKNL